MVNVIDKATFAFANKDMTFDANPLGLLPINIIPAAISGGNLNT